MIVWNTEIVERLKTGSIKNVLLFGDSFERQKAPYVVVKPMLGGDRKVYQIIVHMAFGMQDLLEKYLMSELPELLMKEPLQKDGAITIVEKTDECGGYPDDDDNTLAMYRKFYIPIRI